MSRGHFCLHDKATKSKDFSRVFTTVPALGSQDKVFRSRGRWITPCPFGFELDMLKSWGLTLLRSKAEMIAQLDAWHADLQALRL